MSEYYIGVMSGTSLDGIDIAYCEIKAQSLELIHSAVYPFSREERIAVFSAINTPTALRIIGELDTRLGEMFAAAIENFIAQKGIDASTVTAIGLHGQTLWHEPNSQHPFSMQLGNPNVVAARTGIRVVSDFRRKDIANGGQGAPFTPAFHHYLFSNLEGNIGVLNIGGMANLTLVGEPLIGYDTGCGNVLMDYWVSQHNSTSFDEEGRWAKSGTPNGDLLKLMLQEPYFLKEAPKSTGRELFNGKWLRNKLEQFSQKKGGAVHLKNRDIQATLLELSVASIAQEVKKSKTDLLIVCGGGVKNDFLMKRLQEELVGVKVESSDERGISSKFMEAMAFAWLAHERVHKRAIKLSSVTGAKKDSILGALYE